MTITLDQMSEKVPSLEASVYEEVTEEGVRFAVAVMVAQAQESPEWAQNKALRENVREVMEAWMV
jgi:hypothetical protein